MINLVDASAHSIKPANIHLRCDNNSLAQDRCQLLHNIPCKHVRSNLKISKQRTQIDRGVTNCKRRSHTEGKKSGEREAFESETSREMSAFRRIRKSPSVKLKYEVRINYLAKFNSRCSHFPRRNMACLRLCMFQSFR